MTYLGFVVHLQIHIRTLHTFKHMTIYIYVNKYLHTSKLFEPCCSFIVSREIFTIFQTMFDV